MHLEDLQRKIGDRSARLGVIGLGYVGLPLACLFAEAGFSVVGIELKAERVRAINDGVSPIEGNEPGLAGLLASVVASGMLRADARYEPLRECDVVFVNVETPVDDDHVAQYDALRSALTQLGPVLQPGALVIVESTIGPGTMDGLVRPLLEQSSGLRVSQGFFLGHCPERVMPGRLLVNERTMSRVVGGVTPATAQVMMHLYGHVVHADLDATDCLTAELVKTAENAYRDVNIAFANELGLICEALGADAWRVRELVNKSPGRNVLFPGAGVGGHCIPKDPWLLARSVPQGVPIRLIPAARAVNDSMPVHMMELVKVALGERGLDLNGVKVLILGYAYMENSDDARNSPSEALIRSLRAAGAKAVVHDPFVAGLQGDIMELAAGCNAIVAMVGHEPYRRLGLAELAGAMATPVLIDGRRVFDPAQARAAGFTYRCIGQGLRSE